MRGLLAVASFCLATAACSPDVRELTLLVTPSMYCGQVLMTLSDDLPEEASAISGVFDLGEVTGNPEPDVLRSSGCEPILLRGDPARFDAVGEATKKAVLSFDPLPASGSYVLVGAVYWEPSCESPRGEPKLCFMSEPFGAGVDSDDVHMWGVCAQEADAACFDDGQCGGLECSQNILSCRLDEDCEDGCGVGRRCVEQRCVNAEGGSCGGTLCKAGANCGDGGCLDGTKPCAPATCQDWIPDAEVAPGTPVDYAECVSLLRQVVPPADVP